MKRKLFAAALGIAVLTIHSMAKDIVHNKQIHFGKGTNGATENGTIKGYESYNYKLGAMSGQYNARESGNKSHFDLF